jgi:hypothetical protein
MTPVFTISSRCQGAHAGHEMSAGMMCQQTGKDDIWNDLKRLAKGLARRLA